jgi:hypothetical protein
MLATPELAGGAPRGGRAGSDQKTPHGARARRATAEGGRRAGRGTPREREEEGAGRRIG